MSRVVDIKGKISITQRSDIGGKGISQDVPSGANYSVTYPNEQGDDNHVMENDGTGNLTWKGQNNPDLQSLMYNPFAVGGYDTTSITGLTGTNKYTGGVLAPNGEIYCVPNTATNVMIINTLTNTVDTTTISGLSSDPIKWCGGVLAPNGKIYMCPRSATQVLIIDPETKTLDIASITDIIGTQKYLGCSLAPNGKIYCAPFVANHIGIIDTITDTFDTTSIVSGGAGGLSWGSLSCAGNCLAPNGKIYFIPFNEPKVIIVDPSEHPTYTLSTITSGIPPATDQKWLGGCIDSAGKMYCVPSDTNSVLIIDTTTNDTTTISGLPSFITECFWGCIYAPNKKIYCIPWESSYGLIIDTTDIPNYDTSTISGFSTIAKYQGACIAPNGVIYCIPSTQTNVLKIFPGEPTIPIERCTSAYFNKF